VARDRLYQVLFTRAADRDLQKLPDDVQKRIVRAVAALAHDPRPPGAVKLAGEDDLWRIRVGDYRVIYTVEDDRLVVVVIRIAHRRDAYRKRK
jgi:mRNA interferase RelE/StbE